MTPNTFWIFQGVPGLLTYAVDTVGDYLTPFDEVQTSIGTSVLEGESPIDAVRDGVSDVSDAYRDTLDTLETVLWVAGGLTIATTFLVGTALLVGGALFISGTDPRALVAGALARGAR